MKKNYFRLLFLGIVLVLILMSLLTYRSMNQYTEEVARVRHSSMVLQTLERVLSTMKDAQVGQLGYQLALDSAYLEPFRNSLDTVKAQMKVLDSLVMNSPAQRRNIDTLNYLIENQFFVTSKIYRNTVIAPEIMDENETTIMVDAERNMNRIRTIIQAMKTEQERMLLSKPAREGLLKVVTPIGLLTYTLLAIGSAVFLFTKVLDALDKRRDAETMLQKNITLLQKQNEITEATQRTLVSILDNSLNGIMAMSSVRDEAGKIVDFRWSVINPNARQFLMLPDEDLAGKSLLTYLPDKKRTGMFELYANVVSTGKPVQLERIYERNNIRSWFYYTVIKLEDGILVTFSDITPFKQQQYEIEERGRLLNEAERIADMGSWRWDPSKNFMVWSDGLYRMLNIEKGTLQPGLETFLEYVYDEDLPSMQNFLTQIKSGQRDTSLDYRVLLNGGLKYLHITSKYDQDNNVMLGTVIDITEQKIYEDQLKQYNSELKRSNEDLEQFAYVASHDLQEPLRKIRAFGDRLITKYGSSFDTAGTDYIHRMQLAAARMQTLIEDLLSFSRISRVTGNHEALNLGGLVAEVLDDLDNQIRREQAHIEVGKLPAIWGDKGQIKRLLQNVISNGLKFHKQEVPPIVQINAKKVRKRDVEVEFGKIQLSHPEYVRISIKDNGLGFDEKYADKIFSIFQRLHGRHEFEGTGIGLAICRKIVENHGGMIMARSVENFGSEFIIILPTPLR